MLTPDWTRPLARAVHHAERWLDGLPEQPVLTRATYREALAALGGPLPDGPRDPADVLDDLVDGVEPGLTAMGSGRFLGWVVGGALPAALAADWLVSAWDQNTVLSQVTPTALAVEEIAARWIADLLGLPSDVSAAFVTGALMANFTGLAAGRHDVLARAGWDVEADGLQGAPRLHVVVGGEVHVTVRKSLRLLGLGAETAVVADADEQGRMRPDALAEVLARLDGPTIVCAQAGNVNTGAVDPLRDVCDIAHAHGAWVHVDGAFGLWAGASPAHRHLVDGVDRADSWSTDGHKWLNVPYDCGIAFVRSAEAHTAAFAASASYVVGDPDERHALNLTPEFSRRARGIPVYAALRSLGRSGVEDLVARLCGLAGRFAERLGAVPGVEVLNDVVLNQVLVRFGDDDALTDRVLEAVQREGTCLPSGGVWQGRHVMRISVSNWSTTEDDVDRSVEAIVRALATAGTSG